VVVCLLSRPRRRTGWRPAFSHSTPPRRTESGGVKDIMPWWSYLAASIAGGVVLSFSGWVALTVNTHSVQLRLLQQSHRHLQGQYKELLGIMRRLEEKVDRMSEELARLRGRMNANR